MTNPETPSPKHNLRVTDEMIEAGCAAVLKRRGYDWPVGCDDEEQKTARENVRFALEAALATTEGQP